MLQTEIKMEILTDTDFLKVLCWKKIFLKKKKRKKKEKDFILMYLKQTEQIYGGIIASIKAKHTYNFGGL